MIFKEVPRPLHHTSRHSLPLLLRMRGGARHSYAKILWRESSTKAASTGSSTTAPLAHTVGCRPSASTIQQPAHLTDTLPDRTGSPARLQGRLELVVGPMFAGKTSRLIERMTALAATQTCAAVKSDKDVRYGLSTQYAPNHRRPNGFLHTHDGQSQECFALPRLQQLRKLEGYDQLQVILIDEGHFFEDLREFCNQAVDDDGKHVLVAGLDSDFERNPIGQVNELCPRADQVEKLTAPCAGDGGQCCNRATFTWRMVAAHQQELVGGKESYQPLCRAHYLQHAAQRIQQQRASLDDALRS